MSTKYSGGIITKSPVTPAGPYETGAAPGVWTVEQALQYTKQGIWPTAGNVPNYIENVFSTYLYTGNNSTQTITNGIDLSGKGGMVWFKCRNAGFDNTVLNTVQGRATSLITNSTAASATSAVGTDLSTFNSNGFTLGAQDTQNINNTSGTFASWTFRKQPNFFDVVTYTGDDVQNRAVPHNLGSVPGCIIVKQTNSAGQNWHVWHRSLNPAWTGGTTAGNVSGSNDTGAIYLNTTDAFNASVGAFTYQTSTAFGVYRSNLELNNGGSTYVAYIFAHNAGGFGLTGTDNVISCGSYTGNGSATGPVVTLGYEPQWVMIKRTDAIGNWSIFDNMRGMPVGSADAYLYANSTAAEASFELISPTATGFSITSTVAGINASGGTYIYIAIRRGPMKVPTVGTSVFLPTARTGTGTNTTITTGFVNDSVWSSQRPGGYRGVFDRLRGPNNLLFQNSTGSESAYTDTLTGFDNNTGVNVGVDASWGGINLSGASDITYSFRRAPSFFDEVCYTGTGANTTFTHNLGVVPELMIVKSRSAAGNQWAVYAAPLGNTNVIYLNQTAATSANEFIWNNTSPTSTVFTVSIGGAVNTSAATYVAYLFATCAGVSKVGSYTGTGATQTINCGFGAGGSRFVLIKRTDSTGDWYVWDSARGMVSGTDPSLLLNTTAAEVNANSIYTISTGFQIVSTAAGINASGGTYIFLSIA